MDQSKSEHNISIERDETSTVLLIYGLLIRESSRKDAKYLLFPRKSDQGQTDHGKIQLCV